MKILRLVWLLTPLSAFLFPHIALAQGAGCNNLTDAQCLGKELIEIYNSGVQSDTSLPKFDNLSNCDKNYRDSLFLLSKTFDIGYKARLAKHDPNALADAAKPFQTEIASITATRQRCYTMPRPQAPAGGETNSTNGIN